jgi:hypothetical protein
MPYPIYDPQVTAFFAAAGQACWADYGYHPAEAAQMLTDPQFVAQANLPQLKTMLTYCVRGERFSDGFWGKLITSGKIEQLLQRLMILRTQMD